MYSTQRPNQRSQVWRERKKEKKHTHIKYTMCVKVYRCHLNYLHAPSIKWTQRVNRILVIKFNFGIFAVPKSFFPLFRACIIHMIVFVYLASICEQTPPFQHTADSHHTFDMDNFFAFPIAYFNFDGTSNWQSITRNE